MKNKTTLDTDTISLVNCYIHVDDGVINALAPTGSAQTAVTNSQDVTVLGGSRNIIFDSWESWIHSDLRWNPLTQDRKSTRLNSSHPLSSRMPSSA